MLFGLTQRRRRLAHLQPHPGWRPFSPLKEINRSNVAQLKAICTYTLPEVSSLQTGPLVVDGTMSFTTAHAKHAARARTRQKARRNSTQSDRGEIVEENLFYDLMGILKQSGVM